MEQNRYLPKAEQIFEMFWQPENENKKSFSEPEDHIYFHKRLDKYLRQCAEQIAKDYYIDVRDWTLLTEHYFKQNGGLEFGRLNNFYRYAFIEHRKDTVYVRKMLIYYPSLFLKRTVEETEQTFRTSLNLWLAALDCMSEKNEKPYSLKEYWKNFTSIAEDYKV